MTTPGGPQEQVGFEQALMQHVSRQTSTLDSIKTGVWVLASVVIASLVLALVYGLSS